MADSKDEVKKTEETESTNEQQLDDKDLEKAAGGALDHTRYKP